VTASASRTTRRVAAVVLLLVAPAFALHAARHVGPPLDSALAHYDFDEEPAARWKLPRSLDEVSGLAIDAQGRLFAHDDEHAIIYELDPTTQRVVKRFAFGQPAVRGDFEGIAVVGAKMVLMTSDGVLYIGPEGNDGETVPYTTVRSGIGRQCEVEGLAWDERAREFLFACKTPRVRALEHQLTVFAWPLDRPEAVPQIKVQVPAKAVTRATHQRDLAPSEIKLEPGTGHLLLLAAREHAILEMSPDGEIVAAAKLQHALHRQAEGLAIARDGSLLIADEANGARATLTSYPRTR
jgi:uncharacterized protein YjiK